MNNNNNTGTQAQKKPDLLGTGLIVFVILRVVRSWNDIVARILPDASLLDWERFYLIAREITGCFTLFFVWFAIRTRSTFSMGRKDTPKAAPPAGFKLVCRIGIAYGAVLTAFACASVTAGLLNSGSAVNVTENAVRILLGIAIAVTSARQYRRAAALEALETAEAE